MRGNFDDAQSAVKRIFGDTELAEHLAEQGVMLSSANSINVGRLVPQVVYYFAAYAQLLRAGAIEPGDAVEFCVPTGNFGDILAGYYAKRMGLPVAKLVVASDKNNVLYDFLTTGTYDRQRPFYTTTSPSMDILISSNLERMLYYLSDGNCELVAQLMESLSGEGSYTLPADLLARIQEVFGCGWADEDQVANAIKECWDANGYVLTRTLHAASTSWLSNPPPRMSRRASCSPRRAPTSSPAPSPGRSACSVLRATSPAWTSSPRRPIPPRPSSFPRSRTSPSSTPTWSISTICPRTWRTLPQRCRRYVYGFRRVSSGARTIPTRTKAT